MVETPTNPPGDTTQTHLNVGLARVDITPDSPIRMGGYGARTAPSEGIADPLAMKALAVADGTGSAAVLVTADLIGFDRDFTDAVRADIAEATGLAQGRLLLNASHTHAGPIFGTRYPSSWNLSPKESRAVEEYTEWLRQHIVDVVASALGDMRPGLVSWAGGTVSFMMNRRKFTPSGVQNAPNPKGYVDRSVPVMRVTELDGALRAVVFGASCHNTTVGGDNLRISSEYCGFAQRYVESRHGVHAAFVQGCGASSNPYPRGIYELARQHGETLGAEVCRVLKEESSQFLPVGATLRVASDSLYLPLQGQPSERTIAALHAGGSYYRGLAEKIQQMINNDFEWPEHYRSSASVWRFGDELTLVALPAEVVGDYVLQVERGIGPLGLWVIGYCNDYFGYLPTARVHREGGYEARDFITGYGYLSRGTEDVVIAKVRELAEQVGRSLPEDDR